MPVSFDEISRPPQPNQGVSFEDAQPRSREQKIMDWGLDTVRSLARGVVKGGIASAGLAGDIGELAGAGVKKAGSIMGLPEPKEVEDPSFLHRVHQAISPKTTGQLMKAIGEKRRTLSDVVTDQRPLNAVGRFLEGKPETTSGRYAESIGEFAAPSLAGKGSAVRKALGAIGGGTGAQLASDVAKALGIDHDVAARVIGGILGQSIVGATPKALNPEREKFVKTLQEKGVSPTSGDILDSEATRRAERYFGSLPGSGAAYSKARKDIGEGFTQAASQSMGENEKHLSQEVMERAGQRIGKQFDDLSARNLADYDVQFGAGINTLAQKHQTLFHDPNRKPIVEAQINGITNDVMKNHYMTGEQYQARRSKLEEERRKTSDTALKDFYGDLVDEYDNLMERSIAKTNPGDLGKFKEARSQYVNKLILEDALSKGGEHVAAGQITPQNLRTALNKYQKKAYVRGYGDLAKLARAGEGVLHPPGTSGTSEHSVLKAIPYATGAGVAEMFSGHPVLGAMTAAAPWVPGWVGRGIMSGPGQARLLGKTISMDDLVRSAIAAKAAEGQGGWLVEPGEGVQGSTRIRPNR